MELNLLSLGAGVQSTVIALLAADGQLGHLDGAIFADTGWEPKAVYDQVDRIGVELDKAGIPLYRVAKGNLREDAVDPEHRFVSVPWHTLMPEGTPVPVTRKCDACKGKGEHPDARVLWVACSDCGGKGVIVPDPEITREATYRERMGIGRRQCTSEYKLGPISRKVRELLGAVPPDYRHVPRGRVAVQWIGFSTDEIRRVNDREENKYTRKRYPLLDLGMSRKDCVKWLERAGWGHTVKSACIGCPYHGNRTWRDMRDNRPDEWADAVAFDHAIRKGGARGTAEPLIGEAFLHQSRVPLELAPIDKLSREDIDASQLDLFDLAENDDPDGCSPYGCRSGAEVTK